MKIIADKKTIKLVWGEADPRVPACPADTKAYKHPIKNEVFAQSCILPRPFKGKPEDYKDLDAFREEWKDWRDEQPIVARVVDRTLEGYGTMVVFTDNSELEPWLRMHRATLITQAAEEDRTEHGEVFVD